MDWMNGNDTARGSVQAPHQAHATELRQAESEIVPAHGNGSNPFTKAVKYAAKGRVALVGPAGSGKSYTSLLLARALAGLRERQHQRVPRRPGSPGRASAYRPWTPATAGLLRLM
jgi:Mrp family chromosome partitioning ATPase